MTKTQQIEADFPFVDWEDFIEHAYQQHHALLRLRNSLTFSWDDLDNLLQSPHISNPSSIGLYREGKALDPTGYFQPRGRLNIPQIRALMAQGATLVLNDITALHPSIHHFARQLASLLGARVQANLYASKQGHKGFKTHFDVHDVFAVHLSGEKTWRVYQGRENLPISHPDYHQLNQEYFDQNRSSVLKAITLREDDALYLPRGTYHDALATQGASLHIAFGVTTPTGLDIISALFEALIKTPWGREAIPQDPTKLDSFLKDGAGFIQQTMVSSNFKEQLIQKNQDFIWPHPTQENLSTHSDQYILTLDNLSIKKSPRGHLLTNAHAEVPIPEGCEDMVAWILSKKVFSQAEFDGYFSHVADENRQITLRGLRTMGLLEHQRN